MEGFALLGSHLGDPDRKILTGSQIRTLTERMPLLKLRDPEEKLQKSHLQSLGYGPEMCGRILDLFGDQDQLQAYLREGERQDCHLLTRGEEAYPNLLRKRLG